MSMIAMMPSFCLKHVRDGDGGGLRGSRWLRQRTIAAKEKSRTNCRSRNALYATSSAKDRTRIQKRSGWQMYCRLKNR